MVRKGRLRAAFLLQETTDAMSFERRWARALAHFQDGNHAAARVACEALTRERPRDAGVHWMLSTIAQAGGGFRSSVRHARLAVADWDRLPAMQRLALVRRLISVGDYQAAVGYLESIPVVDPGPPCIGEIIEQAAMLDAHALAGRWLDAAAAWGHRSAQLAFLRGNHRKFTGDIEGAATAYEEAIALSPVDGHALHALAELQLKDGAGRRVDRLRRVIEAGAAAPDSLVAANYGLFRELDRLGDTAGAWEALARGMRLKRSAARHDPDAERAMFAALSDALQAMPRAAAADGGPVPVFILGLPRTGTTLVERMLGNHPDVAACGELSELRMRCKFASDHYCAGVMDAEGARRLVGIDPAAVGSEYLAHVAWRIGDRGWFTDKHPGNALLAGVILRALPQARVVYVRRNAMDACFSNLKALFAPGYYEYSYDITDVAVHYRRHARWMRQVVEASGDRVLEVDYEALVEDPERQVARIVAHCGLPRAEGLTDLARNASAVSTASSVQVRDAIYRTGVDAWQRYRSWLAPLEALLADAGQA